MSQSTPWRPQPPSIADPRSGDAPMWEIGSEGESPGTETETAAETDIDWVSRARDSYRFSTTYIDSNYRQKWDNSIRAFNSEHPSDSNYYRIEARKRSNLFRPKTRAIIRKNEAAAAAAFFSNMDLIDVDPMNGEEKSEVVSAAVTKELLQYRLTKSIPWFQITVGAIQDAQVQGACVGHVYWKFVERHDEDGNRESLEDKPCVDLFPIENLRIDPSAHWLDPVNTSPYLIQLMAMYWCDVKDRMTYPNPKGQKWKYYPPSKVFSRGDQDDSTRQTRNQLSQDPAQQKRDISDYDVVWVHRHIHRYDGEDWEFYTLFSEYLLTEPRPLKETVWHGHRPYVMGQAILETHKPMPNPLPIIIKPLQDEANVIQNTRMDNVLFALNKRYIAKRGKNVDLQSLVRNVPGSITLADDPEGDVRELEFNDVTQSSYLEQDRIDGDFGDLVGNFNPMQVQAQRTGRESTNTMRMLQGPTNLLTEYMLKTFVETWVQPVLRQLVMLEQHYETDMTLLALAGQKAKVFHKYGVSQMGDAVLDSELVVKVNVGMGSTDPTVRMQRFSQALLVYQKLMTQLPPGLDGSEIWKELAALAGYQTGVRFMVDGQNPEVVALQKKVLQLTQLLQKGPMEKARQLQEANKSKEKIADRGNIVKLALADKKHVSESLQMLVEHLMELEKGATDRQGEVEDRNFGAAQESDMAQRQAKSAKPGS
jgi:hypothetical protein